MRRRILLGILGRVSWPYTSPGIEEPWCGPRWNTPRHDD